MTVRPSYDEGKTWAPGRTLWAGPSAYSDLATTADHQIACLFECGETRPYETITLAVFPPESLTEARPDPAGTKR